MVNLCKYCNKEVIGNGSYCNASCRAQHSRRNIKGATSATSPAQHIGATIDEDEEDYTDTEPLTVARARQIFEQCKPAPDLIDVCGNVHKRTMVNGIATVYRTMDDLKIAQEERKQ